jgi:hypothetical protein
VKRSCEATNYDEIDVGVAQCLDSFFELH